MLPKILFVDDEQNVLDAFKRALRKEFQIDTTSSALEALTALQNNRNYAVIVSDMRMPEIDGITFLSRAKVFSPNSVRIMLTGNADQQTAIDAVNEGSIFRFITKPCDPESMAKALHAAVEQHRLIRAEKELIEQTLGAAVQTLTDILSLVNPTAFGRATRVRHLVCQIAGLLRLENAWQVELAAMLSQIGCITIPEDVLQKTINGCELTPAEYHLIHSHPQVGHDLIAHIPRLEPVAEIIACQEKRWKSAAASDEISFEEIPIGARILKVALDLDRLMQTNMSYSDACQEIHNRRDWYDPAIVGALCQNVDVEIEFKAAMLDVEDIKAGMVLAEDVVTNKGTILISSGHEVSTSLYLRLRNFAEAGILAKTIKVLIPIEKQRPATV